MHLFYFKSLKKRFFTFKFGITYNIYKKIFVSYELYQISKVILNSHIFSLCKTAFAVISACLRRHQTAVAAKAAPVGHEMRTALIHGQN